MAGNHSENREPWSVAPLVNSCVCGLLSRTAMADTIDARESRRYLISGMVQGVGYRYFAMRVARRLGLSGYAKNLPDGRVEVYAFGGASKLTELRGELERGPQSASVSGVTEEEVPPKTEFVAGFSIDW